MSKTYDVIIVGAGPTGLSVAIAARHAGLDYLVLDKGGVVDAIRRFPTYMTFFSTPELLTIGDLPFTCPSVRPTRLDALKYYNAVAEYFDITFKGGEFVKAVTTSRNGFEVRGESGTYTGRSVVVATGYYDTPAPFDVPGANMPHVHRFYSEPFAYTKSDIVVLGGGNSAVEAALDLWRAGATVSLVHRGAGLTDAIKFWVRPDIENRIKNKSIASYFSHRVESIGKDHVMLRSPEGESVRLVADAVFALLGYHPDVSLLKGAGVQVDSETMAPVYDAQTYETNVPGLYVAGAITGGAAIRSIFIENSREHGAAIVQSILRR